jgi:Kelch motif/Galactose oxidase, central domain
VLIAGGTDSAGRSLASTEIFDPANGTFNPGPPLNSPRTHGVAIPLKDGRVLFAGGCADGDNDRLRSAELYDPAIGKFSMTGSMHAPRGYFSAVSLSDGRVLVTGGISGGELPNATVEASAEVYDLATERFIPTSPMSTPRYKHGIALLPDGRVMIIGGQSGGAFGPRLSSTEIYDPATARFSRGPEMKFPRFKLLQGVAAIKDGRILVGGGADQPEIYEPASNQFVAVTGPALDAFLFSTFTALPDGKVLLVDGYGKQPTSGAVAHAWLWQP